MKKSTEENNLKKKLRELAEEGVPHDGTETFIYRGKSYLAGGNPYLWSSDAAKAYIFRDETQAEGIIEAFPVVLDGVRVGQFKPENKPKPRHTRPGKIVGCPFQNCRATVIKFEPTDDRDVPTYLNITFPVTLHTCGEKPEGVELIMLPAELVNMVHDHTTLTGFGRKEGEVPTFGLTLDRYDVLARSINALVVGEGGAPGDRAWPQLRAPATTYDRDEVRRMVVEWITRGGDPGATLRAIYSTMTREDGAGGTCEASPATLALDLARELVRQDEEGVRVNTVCECKGSALVNPKDLPRHTKREKDPCLYKMAVDVLVQTGEREKGAK